MRLLGGTSRGDINMMHPAYAYTTCVNNTGDVPLSNLSSHKQHHTRMVGLYSQRPARNKGLV